MDGQALPAAPSPLLRPVHHEHSCL